MASPASLSEEEFRLLTWSRSQLSQITIPPEPLERNCPLDNDRLRERPIFNTTTASSAPLTNIGSLKLIPLEILHSIFNLLDLESLTQFRAISWRARSLVDGLQPYNGIIQHCPNALRALLSTLMAAHFTPQDIFKVLCTQACSGCGQFGPFLDLFTGHRYCFTCVAYSDDLLSITTTAAKKEFGLTSKMIRTLPTLLSIPGRYTELQKRCQRRIFLVRVVAATAARSTQQHNSSALLRRPGEPAGPLPQRPPPSLAHLMRRVSDHRHNPCRFMAMLRFPSLDRQTGNLDWGVSCQACRLAPRDEERGYRDWNTVYSAAGYIEHFQQCEMSQKGRAVASQYTVHVSGDEIQSKILTTARFLAFLSNIKY